MSLEFLLGVPGKLKTLLGLVDVASSTRAPASTALSTAVWPATKAGYLDVSISSRLATAINSIQTGWIGAALGSSGGSEDARYTNVTISSVDTTKAVVLYELKLSSATNHVYQPSARLTSATNLRISLPINDAASVYGRWVVVEFK